MTIADFKFFGRRKGRRVRKAKTTLLEAFLPKLKVSEINSDMFGITPQQIYLEIGFGDGQHLAGQAAKHPEIGFIGAEVFQNGVANLLSLITGIKEGSNLPDTITLTSDRVDNIRIWDDDVRLLFSKIPDNFVDKVFVLFPDPWPKKRHASRRFINPDNLQELCRILKSGGVLRIATDHKVYKGWALRQMHNCPSFRWLAKTSNDWRQEPQDWVRTKYQLKALREGRKPVFLDYEKL